MQILRSEGKNIITVQKFIHIYIYIYIYIYICVYIYIYIYIYIWIHEVEIRLKLIYLDFIFTLWTANNASLF